MRWWLVILFSLINLVPSVVFAAPNLPATFTLSPAKIEVDLKPGDSVIKNIKVRNDLGRQAIFNVEVEDVSATTSSQNLALYGDKDGPYSIRHFISSSQKTFSLAPGEERSIPVVVTVPKTSTLGGRYGAVLFSVESSAATGANVTRVVSRLGTLVFVKVTGQEKPAGAVESFDVVGKHLRFKGGDESIAAQVVYKNTGNIHLNPYGEVVVKNLFGRVLATQKIDPWFVLPSSIKTHDVSLLGTWSFGPNKIIATVYSGYGNKVEIVSATIWYLPSPVVTVLVLVIIIFLFSRFVIHLIHKYRRYD